MIIQIKSEKYLTKIYESLIIKAFSKLEIMRNFLNLITNIYQKKKYLTANIILDSKKLEAMDITYKERRPPSLLYLDIILEVLANAVRQEKEIKYILIGKEEINLSLLSGDMTINVENSKSKKKSLLKKSVASIEFIIENKSSTYSWKNL